MKLRVRVRLTLFYDLGGGRWWCFGVWPLLFHFRFGLGILI